MFHINNYEFNELKYEITYIIKTEITAEIIIAIGILANF